MLLRVPIVVGQEAFAVVWTPAGFRAQPVAVQEEYAPGGVVRALDTETADIVYGDPTRLLALEEVYDGETEAEFVAHCLNRLAKEEADGDEHSPSVTACSRPVNHDAFFSPAEG